MSKVSYIVTSANGKTTELEVIDSYSSFLNDFEIDKNEFFDWGVSATIFPNVDRVAAEWEVLKKKVLNNQKVFIRGYGRDAHATNLYKDMYKTLLGNSSVEKDPTNNTQPHKLIERLTRLKRNKDIFNYQVSHIWGHTKNIFMFEAPWNICYTPKIVDPFTGHETKGDWPVEYQKRFFAKATELYRPFIEDYNKLLYELEIEKRMQRYLDDLYKDFPEKKIEQFIKDATNEVCRIEL